LEDETVSAVLEENEVDPRIVRLESDVAHMRSDTSDIKTDIREFRAESNATKDGLAGLRVEHASLRDEMHSGFAALRDELHSGLAELRDELHRGLAELRAEMYRNLAELRAEMHSGFAALREEMRSADDRLHRQIIRSSLTDRIWMLVLTGTMLAVMARGFKWL
jgi:chromosome segregation ATPase